MIRHRGILLCPAWDGWAVCNARAVEAFDRDVVYCTNGRVVTGQAIFMAGDRAPLPGLR